jgi:GNAT superfamily N-acetyltransferase
MNPPTQVITLKPQHRDRAVEVIARAFRNDPFLSHLTQAPSTQTRFLHWFARLGIKYGEGYGQVYTTPEVAGVAIWFVPGRPSPPPASILWEAVWLPLQVGWSCFWRFFRLVGLTDRVHRGIISGDHWHLFILAVEPERQGQGLGSELLQPVLAQADTQGQACYLETTNPRALPFYRKHGFNIAHHSELGPGGPGFWGLLRKVPGSGFQVPS